MTNNMVLEMRLVNCETGKSSANNTLLMDENVVTEEYAVMYAFEELKCEIK